MSSACGGEAVGRADACASCSPRRLLILSSLHQRDLSIGSIAELPAQKGVITKHQLANYNKMEYGEQRISCSTCNKMASAFCKNCTFTKLSFYSRRVSIQHNDQEKRARAQEIHNLIHDQSRLDKEKNELRAVLLNLEREMERRRSLITEKQLQIKACREKREAKRKTIHGLKTTLQNADRFRKMESERRKAEDIRDRLMADLEEQRTMNCRFLFGIYRLRIEKVEGDDAEVYCMRNGRLPTTLLSATVVSSTHPMDTPDPASLALLVFSTHLVRLLSLVLDLNLPYELSMHAPLSTASAFRSQWSKLCTSVSYLCGSLGVEQRDPHNSLISLFERLCEGRPLSLRSSSLPLVHYPAIEPIDELDPLQSSAEWDTCDDVETPMTASVYSPKYFN